MAADAQAAAAPAAAAVSAASETTGKKGKRWFPLESNPDVMNTYCAKLGLPTDKLSWVDVLSVEDWALGMVPQPVKAVVLLFPIKDKTEEARKAQAEKIKAEGQEVDGTLYFTKQTVGNACGTVGILHSVANASSQTGGDVDLPADGWFAKFVERTLPMDADARAVALEDDQEIEESHEETAQQGQSEVTQDVMTHFVAFVHRGGSLYELDGRKEFPINHGPTTSETLLADAAAAIKTHFIDADPGEMRFTITALAGSA